MIYSQWRPDTGEYDYFDSPTERLGIADDLPIPQLSTSSPIGVPSTEIGRKPSGALTPVGHGAEARGQILPLSRTGLSGTLGAWPPPLWLIVGVALAAGWWLGRRQK